ncbi:MAG: TetR/AcrR family transcriptional regulator [Ktedonobacterales bacterium]
MAGDRPPAHRAGLDTRRVVVAAAALIDAEGIDALTLTALAERLRVRAPSLYNHIAGLDGLRRELALLALRGLAEALGRAAMGLSGETALTAVAVAYRAYAHAHPGLYTLLQYVAPTADEEVRAAAFASVEVLLAVLAGYGLAGDPAIHAIRALRSALHGFVLLEMSGAFALDVDVSVSFARMLALFTRCLPAECDDH